MINKQKITSIPVFGIILIVVGVGLLLRQMNVLRVDGGTLILTGLLAYGGTMIVRSFLLNVRKSLFFGSLCFYSSVILFLGKYDFINNSPNIYIPAFVIVFGLSFLMLFIFNFNDYHLLVPSVIFLGLGISLMLTEIGYWYVSDVKEAIVLYWPLGLILFGGLMLIRRKTKYPIVADGERNKSSA